MTLLADMTYFVFICSVLMSVRPLGLVSTREKLLCMPTNVSCLERLMLVELLWRQRSTKCLKGIRYWFFFIDLVIVLLALMTQWDFFFHYDKATKFLFLEGSLHSRHSQEKQFKTSMLGVYATPIATCNITCGINLQKHIFRFYYIEKSYFLPCLY